MKIQARDQEKQNMFLKPETILKYLITDNDETDTLIMCKNNEYEFIISDQGLYEAMGSIKEYDNFRLNKLIKLLEVCQVMPFTKIAGRQRGVLTHEKVEELRKKALRSD